MRVPFVKMNGAGNDFVMLDNRSGSLAVTEAAIRWLCDRRRGVGADGVIVVEPWSGGDFRMRYYNRDGGEVEMCGNGARCVSLFASRLGMGEGGEVRRLHFIAGAGTLASEVRGTRVALRMTDAHGLKLDESLPVAAGKQIVHLINTGVPHAVIVEPDVRGIPDEVLEARGAEVRYHRRFEPAGTNVDFVAPRPDGTFDIRTYERGVEAETLACGTGTVAVGVVLAHLGQATSPVQVITRGGDALGISFDTGRDGARQVILEGPAMVNYEGTVVLPPEA